MEIKRVLQAPTLPIDLLQIASLQFPMLASDKEDGIRAITHPRLGPVSKTLKPIRNLYIREILEAATNYCLDGELITFSGGVPDNYNDVQSKVMSYTGRPIFTFYVFDCFRNIYDRYTDRFNEAQVNVLRLDRPEFEILPQTLINNPEELNLAEQSALSRGKEGLMLRHPNGWYKEGRSTFRESYLLKIKRFMDDEARVLRMEEQEENCNLATISPTGLSVRSKQKQNYKPKNQMGKLVCLWQGKEIKIGTGFTDQQRIMWWHDPTLILGKTITFKYQKHGMLDLPRAPIFKSIRHQDA